MEDEDVRRFQTIQRCDDLLRKHDFPGTAVRAAGKRLASSRSELERLTQEERRAKRLVPWDGVEIRKRCRNLRKEILAPMAKAARAIDGFMRDTPGAARALRMPHPSQSAALHVEAGERFGMFLKDHRTSFLKETGLDPNLLAKLRAATRELRQQSKLVHTTRGERTRLLREIKSQVRKGRAQIDLLKVLLEPMLIERGLETSWAMASRVGPKMGRPRYTAEERARKRIENAQRKVARREAQKQKREQLRLARRAQRLGKAGRAALPPPPQPPGTASP
jgi:hypothetical protein